MKLKSLLYPAIAVASCNVSRVSADSFFADNDDTIMVEATAEERLKQQAGVSVITRNEIRKKPPVNDVSELVRTMPGVNLTGNSATGSRGNNRKIYIRGMGPENTLIMIDGIPVNSRSSVRYSWRGERDTRGDSNWVPAEQIERIEVIRGPAAARYGSGASGGVVNIITKRPTNNWHGSLSPMLINRSHVLRAIPVVQVSALAVPWLKIRCPCVFTAMQTGLKLTAGISMRQPGGQKRPDVRG